jgi:hypothetical protein
MRFHRPKCLRWRLLFYVTYLQEYAYDTVEVACEALDSSGSLLVIHSLAFKSSPCAVVSSLTLPSQRYMRILCEGARHSGIDAAYCSWLDRVPTALS